MKNLRLIAGFTAALATCVLWTVALADQSSAAPVRSSAPRNGDASHSEGGTTGPGSVATDIGKWRASSADASRAASTPQRDSDLVARGDYLVNRTALCTDCHSPRDEKGALIPSQHLMGAPIPFAPTAPMPWVPAAPRLAGLPAGFNAEQMVRFLMTGERPDGRGQPLPPMPPFRFDRDDAQAITAYLRTLPAK